MFHVNVIHFIHDNFGKYGLFLIGFSTFTNNAVLFQAEDVEKLKQENRKLRVDIQLLARQIDLADNGQSKSYR